MRFNQYLHEEYCTVVRVGRMGGTRNPLLEIYVNPSKDEVKEYYLSLGDGMEEIRYTADSRTKKLFIWDANHLNHHNAILHLIKVGEMKLVSAPGFPQYSEYLLNGFAGATRNGKLEMGDSDDLFTIWNTDRTRIQSKLNQDWTWLKPYFNSISQIKQWKKLHEEYETTLRSGDMHYTVFKNPDSNDFKDLVKEIRRGGDRDLNVRMLVDEEHENLYIWDANKALHYTVMHNLVKTTNISNKSSQLSSTLHNNKISFRDLDIPWSVPSWCKEYFI